MLSERGLHGTFYVSFALMGKTTESGEMFEVEDIEALVASGHELGCHTFDHIACRNVAVSEIVSNCEKNRAAVRRILPGYELQNFSYPFGATALASKSALAAKYLTCRSIRPGINRGRVDLALLKAYSLCHCSDALMRVIEENAKRRGWVIVYTHDVVSKPSPYGCTPETFMQVLRCAVSSGADILPISAAMKTIAITHPGN